MIPLGHITIRSKLGGNSHWTHFTRDEQLTLLSLWALAPSPLMLGMNLPDNDEWTTALLTSPEVYAINQDPAAKPARRLFVPGLSAEIWVRELVNGSHAVGLFNRTSQPAQVVLAWNDIGFSRQPDVRDLWLRKDLGQSGKFIAEIPPHGCRLLGIKAP
jgi:hypothetical protein